MPLNTVVLLVSARGIPILLKQMYHLQGLEQSKISF